MLRREWERFVARVVYSWAGVLATWKSEPSFKFWFTVNIISIIGAFALDLTGLERALILSLGVLILAAECMNTAVEKVVDMISPDYHDIAKFAKDAASAGVALTAVAAGIAWLCVLL
jgi:diacylglycerol kinase (ATP)